MAEDLSASAVEPGAGQSRRQRRWTRRRNRFGIRNGRFVALLAISALAGIGATVFTAYLGLR